MSSRVCVCTFHKVTRMYGWEIVCEIQFKSLYFIYHHIIIILVIVVVVIISLLFYQQKGVYLVIFIQKFAFFDMSYIFIRQTHNLLLFYIWFTLKMRFQLKMYKLMLCVHYGILSLLWLLWISDEVTTLTWNRTRQEQKKKFPINLSYINFFFLN